MFLQVTKDIYGTNPIGTNDYFYKNHSNIHDSEGADFESADGISLPILATANDLREAVKLFKHKQNGVSVIEMNNAEPRRVFDARKIAAYEFWGILSRAEERFQLTALGEELANNTEAECRIHRRILRAVPAYQKAVEWIFAKSLEIATFHDVANFWQMTDDDLSLSRQSEENIEAVIVSFFSLCHAAELGTATVGKRGQPARLSVRLEQIKEFLDAAEETDLQPAPPMRKSLFRLDKNADENIGCVYISAGRFERESANLCAALELADFGNIAFGADEFENGFLPSANREAMKQCQAAIILLDEKDCRAENGKIMLRCDRVTEISVAQALFGERVIMLWNSSEKMPEVFGRSGFNVMRGDISDWNSNFRLVRCLKSLNG